MGKEQLSHLEGRTSCHLSALLGSLGQSPHGPLPTLLKKHVHWGMQQGETTIGAGTLPRPHGGPAMAARSLPTSAQVSFWFNNQQTVRVSCGHPLWTVQPPAASAVLGTRLLLFLKPPPCPLLPLMTQGHPHRCPGADGQTVSAAGPLLQSPLHSELSRVPLP